MTTTNEKLSPNQAQRIMLNVMTKTRQQVDIAASSQASPRDRKRALARVERAIAALSPTTK